VVSPAEGRVEECEEEDGEMDDGGQEGRVEVEAGRVGELGVSE
jgi:hypothetical protein